MKNLNKYKQIHKINVFFLQLSVKKIFFLIVIFSILSFFHCISTQTIDKKNKCSNIINIENQKVILKLNPDGHTDMVTGLVFTKDGKKLISASKDKTIRIYDVSSGKHLKTIRSEIGNGRTGSIFALSISPNNKWLATGGYFTKDNQCNNNDRKEYIRIYELESYKVAALLKCHTDSILSLEFSNNGKMLACSSKDSTISIWNVPENKWDGSEKKSIHILRGHKDAIYALSWLPSDRRLLSGSNDKNIILWDVIKGIKVKKITGHKRIVSCLESYDDNLFFSGSFDGSLRLWNLSNDTFCLLEEFKVNKYSEQVLSLSLSNDKNYLITSIGPKCKSYQLYPLNELKDLNSNQIIKSESLLKHDNYTESTDVSVSGLAASGGGSKIYVWDIKDCKIKYIRKSLGNKILNVAFNNDGTRIAWGIKSRYKNPNERAPLQFQFQLFSDKSKTYVDLKHIGRVNNTKEFFSSINNRSDYVLKISNNYKTLNVLKKSKKLAAIKRTPQDGYCHYSYSFTPDFRHVISSGSGGFLTLYRTSDGSKVREFKGHTGDVWTVAISPDGSKVLSGSTDQTIKLWDIETGKIILNLFPMDDEEWVAWISEGFYTSSGNSSKYIGYHVNKGIDKNAIFINFDQIYRLFLRPDLVAMRLIQELKYEKEIKKNLVEIGTIDKFIQNNLPPKVTVISKTKNNKNELIIDLLIEDQGGGIGDIEYFRNGVITSVTSERRTSLSKPSTNMQVKPSTNMQAKVIIDFDSDSYIRANSAEEKTYSEETINDKKISSNCEKIEKPDLHLIAIGVSEYSNIEKLKYAHSDAKAIIEAFKNNSKELYNNIIPKELINKEATKINIKKAFNKLSKKRIKKQDTFILFMAGHGLIINNSYHFALYNANPANLDGYFSKEDIKNEISKLKGPEVVLLLLDTCYSGDFSDDIVFAGKVDSVYKKLHKDTGVQYITASDKEVKGAFEGLYKHGVFTGVLIEGIAGRADKAGNQDDKVSIKELSEYVQSTVKAITKLYFKYVQFPSYSNSNKAQSFLSCINDCKSKTDMKNSK